MKKKWIPTVDIVHLLNCKYISFIKKMQPISQVDNFFCKLSKLFSQNLQNIGYIQTSQLIIYKKQIKYDN